MGTIVTIGRSSDTGLPVHVKVSANGLKCNCTCYDCNDHLEAIQGSKGWHFRHHNKSGCSGNGATALHEYAKQVLFENNFVYTGKRRIDYTNPHKDTRIETFYSDVSARYLGQDLHFEVVVHEDFLNTIREIYYKSSRVNCIRIDLREPGLLRATPEEIKYAVLEDPLNKDFLCENENSSLPVNIAPVTVAKDYKWAFAFFAIIPFFLLTKKLFPRLIKGWQPRKFK